MSPALILGLLEESTLSSMGLLMSSITSHLGYFFDHDIRIKKVWPSSRFHSLGFRSSTFLSNTTRRSSSSSKASVWKGKSIFDFENGCCKSCCKQTTWCPEGNSLVPEANTLMPPKTRGLNDLDTNKKFPTTNLATPGEALKDTRIESNMEIDLIIH